MHFDFLKKLHEIRLVLRCATFALRNFCVVIAQPLLMSLAQGTFKFYVDKFFGFFDPYPSLSLCRQLLIGAYVLVQTFRKSNPPPPLSTQNVKATIQICACSMLHPFIQICLFHFREPSRKKTDESRQRPSTTQDFSDEELNDLIALNRFNQIPELPKSTFEDFDDIKPVTKRPQNRPQRPSSPKYC